MRGASSRGNDPRGAYQIILRRFGVQVIETTNATGVFDGKRNPNGQVTESASAQDSLWGKAQAAAIVSQPVSTADALSYASTVLGQIESGVISYDQLTVLAQAAGILADAAVSSFLVVAAETGVTPVFAVEATQAEDAYTAAAMAYGHTIGITDATEALSATAKALAGYAIHTQASDLATGAASTDSTGPLRGAINLTAALRGQVWLAPSPGPKGGRPH